MASLCLGVVRTCPRVRVRASSSLTCGDPRILRIHPQYPVCRSCCCHLVMHVERFFLCVVLIEVVFFGTHLNCPHNVGDCDSPRLVFDRSYPFLDHLACDFFRLSSPFGVVLRYCVGCRVILRGRWS